MASKPGLVDPEFTPRALVSPEFTPTGLVDPEFITGGAVVALTPIYIIIS